MQKGQIPALVLVGILIIIAVAGGAYFLLVSTTPNSLPPSVVTSQTPKPTTNTTLVSTGSAASPAPNGAGETANWKTYNDRGYSFKYPNDWKLTQTDYLNTVSVTSPQGSVAIQISEGQYPYGFEGPGITFDKRDLNVRVGDKDYKVKETIVNGRKTFVDFPIDSPRHNNILFGTGYPVAEDRKASLEDYEKSKKIILEVLSTFKFQ